MITPPSFDAEEAEIASSIGPFLPSLSLLYHTKKYIYQRWLQKGGFFWRGFNSGLA